MLVLSRKPNEKLTIGDDIVITIVEIDGNKVRLGIDAPSTTQIWRAELLKQLADETPTPRNLLPSTTVDHATR